ncbi:hypothetical protein EAW55_08210, partial [Legionella jordanis]
ILTVLSIMRVFLLVLFQVRTSIKTGNSLFFKYLCQIKSKLIHFKQRRQLSPPSYCSENIATRYIFDLSRKTFEIEQQNQNNLFKVQRQSYPRNLHSTL